MGEVPEHVNPVSSQGSYWWSFPDFNMLVVHLPGGHLGSLPVYINNAKSLLYHEYLHLSGKFKGKANTKQGTIDHLGIYELQIQHELFGLCTSDFKQWIFDNFRDYVEELGPNGDYRDLGLYAKWKSRLKELGL